MVLNYFFHGQYFSLYLKKPTTDISGQLNMDLVSFMVTSAAFLFCLRAANMKLGLGDMADK